MVRRHGWQLPAHAFQVVAITAFFLLVVAFYVFLIPFLGNQSVEYSGVVLYSCLAVTVFFLYVRCSAIDPADPGVFAKSLLSSFTSELQGVGSRRLSHLPIPTSSPCRTKPFSGAAHYVGQGWDVLSLGEAVPAPKRFPHTALSCLLCSWFVRPDNCRSRGTSQQPISDEDILFCTLCNAEVRKHSKHCRSCDKCVDGFDHHCRWLNNCVGSKNYGTFVALMFTSLALLTVEWGIGTAVLVRCFVDEGGVESQIVDKLGNSFSKPPFATLVAICAGVSFVATIPLGELLFFHLILIRKGISTYEYVIAMRAQGDIHAESADGDVPSVPSTPASSTATGLSGSSSMGLHIRGAWCTPPKIFVEHQDEVVPHLDPSRVRSTVDPDVPSNVVGRELRMQKRPVRISAWKLAKLNAEEAALAAVKARETSSVLRHVGGREGGKTEIDYNSSGNLSRVSSVSTDHRLAAVNVKACQETSCRTLQSVCSSSLTSRGEWNSVLECSKSVADSLSPGATDLPLSPAGNHVPNSNLVFAAPGLSSLQEVMLSPSTLGVSRFERTHLTGAPGSSVVAPESCSWADLPAASDGYEASSGESADDLTTPTKQHGATKLRKARSHIYGPEGEGNFRRCAPGGRKVGDPNNMLGTCMVLKSRLAWPNPMTSSVSEDPVSSDFASEVLSSSQASPSKRNVSLVDPGAPDISDTLLFKGTCIFYGGPLTLTAKLPTGTDCPQSLAPRLSSGLQELRVLPAREGNSESCSRPVIQRSQSPVFQPSSGSVPLTVAGQCGTSHPDIYRN